MWAYDLLCLVDYLSQQKQYEKILVAGRGKETGLACLFAAVLDERIKGAAIDRMFSSFVELVGYNNPGVQIPGILGVTDVEHLMRAAGKERVRLNNLSKSQWSGSLESSAKPPTRFFEEWLKADAK
ncbi:MAG: hypothetical protein V9H26_23960 [Verrucomicrobiota bacterium]